MNWWTWGRGKIWPEDHRTFSPESLWKVRYIFFTHDLLVFDQTRSNPSVDSIIPHCAMRTSRSAASLHSKHLTPPPTDRLWLNLNNPSTASSRTTPQPSLHSSHTTTTTATANIHFNNFNNAPIRPLILSKTQMTQDKWHRLQIQTKVLEQLDMRTADSNKRATAILSMFRACNPDEFGLIHLHTFQPYFSQTFALTPHEEVKCFRLEM